MSVKPQEVIPIEIPGDCFDRKGEVTVVVLGDRDDSHWALTPSGHPMETVTGVRGLLRVTPSASQADAVKAARAWMEATSRRLKLTIASFEDQTRLYRENDIVQMVFKLKRS